MIGNESPFPNEPLIPNYYSKNESVEQKKEKPAPLISNQIPSTLSFYNQDLKSDHLITPINPDQLWNQVSQIQNTIDMITFLDPNKPSTFQKFIEENRNQFFENLIEQLNVSFQEEAVEQSDEILLVSSDPFRMPFVEVMELLAKTMITFDANSLGQKIQLSDEWMSSLGEGMQMGIIFGNSIGRGGLLIMMGTLIKQANEVIALKKKDSKSHLSNRDVNQRKIELLESWVKRQKVLLKKYAAESALSTSLAVPKATSVLMQTCNMASTPAGMAFSWMSSGFAIVTSALQWRRSAKRLEEHRLWTETFKSGDLEKVKNEQQRTFEKRLKINTLKIKGFLEILEKAEGCLPQDQKRICDKMLEELKKFKLEGLENIANIQELKAYLSSPETPNRLNDAIIKKETLSVSLRNALKALAAKKETIDRDFFKFESHKAKAMFSAATVVTALVITLKVLAIIGVAIAAGALMGTGYGLIAVAIVLFIVGLAYLYYKKPNLFKTFLKGVQARLAFHQVPLMIQRFRRQNAMFEASRVSESIRQLSARKEEIARLLMKTDPITLEEIPEKLRKRMIKEKIDSSNDQIKVFLENYQSEITQRIDKKERKITDLNSKLSGLADSVEKQEKKVEELKARIREAGWKDYVRALAFPRPKGLEDGKDEADILAEFLLQDETLLEDTETAALLKKLNIDLADIYKKSSDRQELIQETASAIRAFFAMDDAETLTMIRKQLLSIEE